MTLTDVLALITIISLCAMMIAGAGWFVVAMYVTARDLLINRHK